MHEVIRTSVSPGDGVVGRTQGRRRRVARRGEGGYTERNHQPQRSRHDCCAAQARRGCRSDRTGRRKQHAHERWHHVRTLSLDRRQFIRAKHRPSPRRVAEPRSERRRDHRAVAGDLRRAKGGVSVVGAGNVRCPLQHRRQEHASRNSTCVRVAPRGSRALHGRRHHLLLERLRRDHADARTWTLRRSTHRRRRQQSAGARRAEAGCTTHVSIQLGDTGPDTGHVRC